MHPALSVIFFTTLSGLGYGIWAWTGLRLAAGQPLTQQADMAGIWVLLLAGAVLSAAGLFASFWHLGKPMRAWRAFSQWRTSWLSREGVLAALAFVPAAVLLFLPTSGLMTRVLGVTLLLLALATVACTAMIYASLKPIPAWRHRLVLPGYLGFSLLGGGLVWLAMMGGASALVVTLMLLAAALVLLKLRYWRDIDRTAMPQTRGDAVGLPSRKVSVFERPHTEATYITREMGFVLARRHARSLRVAALLLFGLVPLLALLLLSTGMLQAGGWLWLLPLAALAGSFLERWLFFAQARHIVSLYY